MAEDVSKFAYKRTCLNQPTLMNSFHDYFVSVLENPTNITSQPAYLTLYMPSGNPKLLKFPKNVIYGERYIWRSTPVGLSAPGALADNVSRL